MMASIAKRHFWWLLIVVAGIWFANLEYRTLIKPDEGRYAEIPREMVVSGDWVTPRLNDLKYFEKPPLQYWATATAYTVFGEHQWTSRLWAALTGFAGLFLVWFAGVRLFGREAAAYATLLLASSLLYEMMAHINTLDMGVTFFITLGILSLLLAQSQTEVKKQRNWMLLAWTGMALAVLSKGLMGIILPGTAVFIYCLVQRDFSVLKRMHWLPGIALFLLITAPWFYLVMKANPEFFGRFFIYEHYTRFTTKDLGRYQPWYYFVPILLAGALPWTVLMFDSLFRAPAVPARAFNPSRFLLIWAMFIYVFFSISGSKLPSYLLPMFPALVLLMGQRLAQIRERVLFWQMAPVVPVALVFLWLGLLVGKFADTPNQIELYPHYSAWLVTASLILLSGLLGGMALLWRAKKPAAVLLIALSTLLAAQVGVSGYNTVARERSAKHIAEAIREEVKPDITFYSVLTYEQTLAFYLKHTFTLVQYQDEMGFGIKQEPERWVPTLQDFAGVWASRPEALAIMPAYLYPQLQQMGLSMQIIFQDTQHIVVKKP
ncbi:MAG: glycosyltransferase family 39 protein [Gallionella sp.]|jgi:4-amino-4-deoxy-L-arabinose transferase-like glycosyltransferase